MKKFVLLAIKIVAAALAVVVAGFYLMPIDRHTPEQITQSNIAKMSISLDRYWKICGSYPKSLMGRLDHRVEECRDHGSWFSRAGKDGYGNSFNYESDGRYFLLKDDRGEDLHSENGKSYANIITSEGKKMRMDYNH